MQSDTTLLARVLHLRNVSWCQIYTHTQIHTESQTLNVMVFLLQADDVASLKTCPAVVIKWGPPDQTTVSASVTEQC